MKKEMFVLAALATLAACSKTEVTPVASNVNSEITFNVAPRTKALSQNQTDFDHNNVFVSYAYYLGHGKTWAANNSEAQMYIDGSTISYNGNLWKNETTSYYWPKDGGSLTFFAYSYNKKDMTVGDNSGFACVWAPGEDGQYQGGINGHFDVATNKMLIFLLLTSLLISQKIRIAMLTPEFRLFSVTSFLWSMSPLILLRIMLTRSSS